MFTSARGDRRDVHNVAVVITDGRSDNEDDTWREAIELRQTGTLVISVGIGGGVKTKELNGMASDPITQNVLVAPDFETLSDDLISTLSNAICNSECTIGLLKKHQRTLC